MHEIKFECEVITPMFLAGADGKTPELRAPSIKGVMRFWWRAMNGHLSIEDLRKKEAEIFGGSGENEGRSKVIIQNENPKISEENISISLWNEIDYEERTARRYKIPRNNQGIAYLFYSVLMLNERPYIKAGSKFFLKIKCWEEKTFKNVIALFKIVSLFGGLGSRSRRGAGSFIVKKGLDKNFYGANIDTAEKLEEYIKEKIKPLIFSSSKSNHPYSVLTGAKVYIFEPKNSWIDALESIGKPFKDFRSNNKKRVTKTPNLGFPILHNRGRTLFGAGIKNDRNGTIKDFLNRRSSPLIFKVVKVQEDCFIPLILWMNGELIPSNYKIMDKRGNNTDNPDTGIIKEFINSLTSKKIEVNL